MSVRVKNKLTDVITKVTSNVKLIVRLKFSRLIFEPANISNDKYIFFA